MFANPLNDDPLGLGLRQRARDAKAAYDAQNRELARQNGQLVSFSNLGPISDPQWDAFKQALYEQGVDTVAGGAGLSNSRFGANDIYGGSTAVEGQTPITEMERRGGHGAQTAARQAFQSMRRRR